MLKLERPTKYNIFLWAIRRVKNIYVIQAVKKLYISHLKVINIFFSSFFFQFTILCLNGIVGITPVCTRYFYPHILSVFTI